MCTHTDQVHHEQDLELAVVAKVQMSRALCQSPEGSEECPTSFSEKMLLSTMLFKLMKII